MSEPGQRRLEVATRVGVGAIVVLSLVLAGLLADHWLPEQLPAGVVVQGALRGGLEGLVAMGLVLVYRSARIVNFAQAAIGGLAATVAILLVVADHWPYAVAVPVALAVALLVGLGIDALVQRWFSASPRLVVTVVTLAVLQLLAALDQELPHLFGSALSPLGDFRLPFAGQLSISPLRFTSDAALALAVVPLALAAVWWLLTRTDTGLAIRGAADSAERVRLLGIPVRNLSRLAWVVAAGLSGLGVVLAQPLQGPSLTGATSAAALLAPLAAAVLAGMSSLPLAVFWSVVIGVLDEAVLWNYHSDVGTEVVLFVVILVGLVAQRHRLAEAEGSAGAERVEVHEVHRLPTATLGLQEIRAGRFLGGLALAALLVLLPLWVGPSTLLDASYVAIYALIAVSLVVLAGWAGQISLGQFALVGVGAAVTGALIVHVHLDFALALVLAGAAGGLVALAVGLPALRLPGLFLGPATLAFAVAVSDWLLAPRTFPALTPARLVPPVVFSRFDLGSFGTLYEVCLLVLAGAVVVVRNLRRARAGRAVVAVRENPRAAAAYGINPLRARLLAFGISGVAAGVAGALYVVAGRGIDPGSFAPELSVTVLLMVVIGGLGSLTGAVLGALFVETVQLTLSPGQQLAATGLAVLVVLVLVPEGLGGLVYAVRDWLVEQIERATPRPPAATSAPAPDPDREGSGRVRAAALRLMALEDLEAAAESVMAPSAVPPADPPDGRPPVLAVADLEVVRGSTRALAGVSLGVAQGEVLAMLGTTGAGKSTLLRAMVGLQPLAGGSVTYRGQPLGPETTEQRAQAGLVAVFGGRGVLGSLTVAQNLRLASWHARRQGDEAFVAAAEERIGVLFPALAERRDVPAGQLSRGEQQMLTVAQALLCRPTVLLVDELSVGLAPAMVANLLAVVRGLAASGVTVVLVEEFVNVATAVATRAVFFERGRVRFSGPTPELAAQPELLRSVFVRAAERARRRRPVAPDPAAGSPSAAVLAALGAGLPSAPADPAPTPPRTATPAPVTPPPPGSSPDGQPVGSFSTRPTRWEPPPVLTPAIVTPRPAEPVPEPGPSADDPALGQREPAPGEPAPAGAPALRVEGLAKHYGGITALDDVSLAVAPGEILGIIGSNGAGKTTLFDVCSGFLVPDAGRVLLDGVDVGSLSPSARAVAGMGRVFSAPVLWPAVSVREALATALERTVAVRDPLAEALALAPAVRAEAEVEDRVDALIDQMGLGRHAARRVDQLGAGTRRIVELACALAHQPSVLLLDEPTAGLAQRESDALGQLLVGLSEETGATLMVIEHDVPLVASVADRLICLDLGRVVAQGPTEEVLEDPAVVRAYLGTEGLLP